MTNITLEYYEFGHTAISIQNISKGTIQNFYADGVSTKIKRACPKCKQLRTKEGHDPCIANLPGVEYACCGHGQQDTEAYVKFNNGKVLRGKFDID